MSSFIFVPAQRIISGSASITRELTPNPSGSNMAQLLLTLRNDMDERFDVLRSIIKKMFPEIDDILTLITGANQTKIIIQDRFSGQRVGINDCGTGVAQMMHLLALILFSPPGRLFLIDEPHVYLHASAERALAEVIRTHPEHHYVIATHSPVLIDALQPDRIWLVTRDARGSMITPLFALGFEERRYVFRLLGWKPSQFAWADRILFVEGDSDDTVWQAWFRLWGWDNPSVRCAVVSLDGAGLTRPLASVIDELSSWLLVPMRVVLDGDQRGTIQSPYVDFLPEVEIENLLIRDVRAVRDVLLVTNPDIDENRRPSLMNEWTEEVIQQFLTEHKDKKGSKKLIDLANHWGVHYRKTVHNPLIAEHMDPTLITDVQEVVRSFILGTEHATG
ncbi:MAG: hypothetical protein FE78DRAFT_29175 [Acidomyces sp. 'richmondensis']|nr:MAG: hypothetical protein FE78DRAFT_29175 [Acidomyces sp. 'richmondensis']